MWGRTYLQALQIVLYTFALSCVYLAACVLGLSLAVLHNLNCSIVLFDINKDSHFLLNMVLVACVVWLVGVHMRGHMRTAQMVCTPGGGEGLACQTAWESGIGDYICICCVM